MSVLKRSRLCVLGLAAALLLAGLRMASHYSAPNPVGSSLRLFLASDVPSKGSVTNRPMYRYSVIAGGAYTPEELARARRTDAVVAAHYASFGDTPHFLRAERDLLVYVSYRKSDRIFWTRARHRVPQGEMLIQSKSSDLPRIGLPQTGLPQAGSPQIGSNQAGSPQTTMAPHLARARCGNQLSQLPQSPVASDEPSEDVLGATDLPKLPLNAFNLDNLPIADADAYVPASEAPTLLAQASPSEAPPYTPIASLNASPAGSPLLASPPVSGALPRLAPTTVPSSPTRAPSNGPATNGASPTGPSNGSAPGAAQPASPTVNNPGPAPTGGGNVSTIPEPSSSGLLCCALVGCLAWRRVRK